MSETAKLPPVAELYACACGHEHFECERCHTHHTFPNRDGLLLRLLAKLLRHKFMSKFKREVSANMQKESSETTTRTKPFSEMQ